MNNPEDKLDIRHHLPQRKMEVEDSNEESIAIETKDGYTIYPHDFNDIHDTTMILKSSDVDIEPKVLDTSKPWDIILNEDLDNDDIEDLVQQGYNNIREKISEIEKLGLPKEQFKLVCNEKEITLSNYTDLDFSKQELDEIALWYSTIISICREGVGGITNIILLPDEFFEVDGKLKGGVNFGGLNTIAFPGITFNMYRNEGEVDECNSLSEMLTHEVFHVYNRHGGTNAISKKWNEISGWNLRGSLDGSFNHGDHIPEGVKESIYGKESPAEEFCDSAAKAIFNRGNFKDKKKLEFFDKNFFKKDASFTSVEPVEVKIMDDEVKVPEFDIDVTYSVVNFVEDKND